MSKPWTSTSSVNPESAATTPLRVFRVIRGLSQAALADRCDLDPATISRLEQGRHRPYASTRKRIAEALGIDEELLFPVNTPTDMKRG